jgi:acyl dehydratase
MQFCIIYRIKMWARSHVSARDSTLMVGVVPSLPMAHTSDDDPQRFDFSAHRMCEQRYFEDFRLNERFILPSRTMTDAMFAAFQLASGDNHPIHYDVEYCRRLGMPQMLAHGFQVLIQTAAGAGLFPHMVEESLKAFIEQSSRFVHPVFAGDTLYSALEVIELVPGRTTGVLTMKSSVVNQAGVLVLDGKQKYLIRKRSA